MTYDGPVVEGTLIRRWKRYLCAVRLPGGQEVTAWCPNPGRMTSCSQEGAPCRITFNDDPKRKLQWTLEQVCMDGTWVMVHPARANAVVQAALARGHIPELAHTSLERERRYGVRSRVDFLLDGTTFVEVKNVTMVRGDAACFPDAVSARGTRHLRELIDVVAGGNRGVLLFHVGRADVDRVRPADEVDPLYGATLREAVAAGVEVLAYRCEVGRDSLVLREPLPVEI